MSSNSNSNSNSNRRSWLDTKIGVTDLARETDPFRILSDDNYFESFDVDNPSDRKRVRRELHDAVDKLSSEPRMSVAMDAAMSELDEPSRQYLSGLRAYFSSLQADQPLNVACCRALLKRVTENI